MRAGRHAMVKRVIVLVLAALMVIGSIGATAVFAAEQQEVVKDGPVKEGGKLYLYKNGVKVTQKGIQSYQGYYYYIQKDGSALTKTFKKIKSADGEKKLVYYDKQGHAVRRSDKKTGFVTIGKYKYYIKKNYEIVTGWKKIDGKRYYFNPKQNGRMVTGVKKIKGTKYDFSKKGVLMLGDPDINKKAQGYDSPTGKLILVNRARHKVSIYKGKKGKWECIQYWPCVVGQITMQTPVGVHHLTGFKGLYFDSHGLRWWYFTCYHGNTYHFHSQGYSQADLKHTKLINGAMNENASAGCIRLYLENARWLQKNCPARTTVVVYN